MSKEHNRPNASTTAYNAKLAALATAYRLLDDTRVLTGYFCRLQNDAASYSTADFYMRMLQCALTRIYRKAARKRFETQGDDITPPEPTERNSSPPQAATSFFCSNADSEKDTTEHARDNADTTEHARDITTPIAARLPACTVAAFNRLFAAASCTENCAATASCTA